MTAGARFLASLCRAGRLMVLKRRIGTSSAFTECTVHGRARSYKPYELVGGVVLGDRQVRVSQAEIEAAAWPGPPRKGDSLDGGTVQGAETLYDGAELVGFVVWVRG